MVKSESGTPELERWKRPSTILEEGGVGTHICPLHFQMQALQSQLVSTQNHVLPHVFIFQIDPKSLNGQLYLTDAFFMRFLFSKNPTHPLRATWSLHSLWVNHTVPFLRFLWHYYLLILLFLLCPLLPNSSLTSLFVPSLNFLEHLLSQKFFQNGTMYCLSIFINKKIGKLWPAAHQLFS